MLRRFAFLKIRKRQPETLCDVIMAHFRFSWFGSVAFLEVLGRQPFRAVEKQWEVSFSPCPGVGGRVTVVFFQSARSQAASDLGTWTRERARGPARSETLLLV